MNAQLQLIETPALPQLSFTALSARVTEIHVERVFNTDERTGQRYVAYHTFKAAYGEDVRDGERVEITFEIDLRGKRVSAFNNVRITPREWKDEMLALCKEHGVRATRLGILDAKYVIADPA